MDATRKFESILAYYSGSRLVDGCLDGIGFVVWKGGWDGHRGEELLGAGCVTFDATSRIGPRLGDSSYQNASELFAVLAGLCCVVAEIPSVKKVHLVSDSTTVLGWIKTRRWTG